MPWTKLDSGFAWNAKIVKAGNEVVGAWVRLLSWCSSQMTNGRFTHEIGMQIAHRRRVLDRMVELRLVEQVEGGYQIHDYLQFQASRQQIQDRVKEISESRSRSGRLGAQNRWKRDQDADGKPMANENGVCHAFAILPSGTDQPCKMLPKVEFDVKSESRRRQNCVASLGNSSKVAQTGFEEPAKEPTPQVPDNAQNSMANRMANGWQTDGKPDGKRMARSDPIRSDPIAHSASAGAGTVWADVQDWKSTGFSEIGRGAEREIPLEQFEGILMDHGLSALSPRWYPVATQLAPFSRDEIRLAFVKAHEDSSGRRVAPGFLLRILERWRSEPPESPKRPPPGSEWSAARKREDELLAREKGQPAKEEEPPFSSDGAAKALEILKSLTARMSM